MNVKLHLNIAEFDPLERTAEAFGCNAEDIVYSALNDYMLKLGQAAAAGRDMPRDGAAALARAKADVLATKQARGANLPLWADSACSVHNYEGKGPDYGEKSGHAAY